MRERAKERRDADESKLFGVCVLFLSPESLSCELVGFVPVESGLLGIILWNKVETALIKLIFDEKKLLVN